MLAKMTGRVKAGEGSLIGNAGEHYVMAELLKRGIPHDKTTPKRNLNQETYGKELEKYLDNWEGLGFP